MSPTEVFLAKAFAAWCDWPGAVMGERFYDDATNIGDVFFDMGLQRGWEPTAEGLDLLDRARKAGVLP